MKLHLVDGTFELFRAHFGAPNALSPAGIEVGASRGILRSLLNLLREPECTHVGVAFDHVIRSYRNDMFDGYKTGDDVEPEILAQFPIVERVAAALGLVVWPMVEFEADDALATAATRFSPDPRVDQIIICSPDKDFAQCVRGQRVVLHDRIRDRVIDEEGVHEKWGVGPGSIPDLLGLMGDTADGIPGIPRWGQKSSATLLAEYQTIESIPADPDSWSVKARGAKGLSENLESQREAALLYKELATLRCDVPLTESIEDLEWRGARRGLLADVADEIGDQGILERIERWRD
ncbi:MAG: flap endonuclease [Gemmatimonadetes bacterium]|jgi:5'-3' exonuclease|nr:flap endonuclease [Gemmatimonadota bacterium]MBT4610731.1 flap endonuclease [Gemmatimonadota bacterium]MBT5059342.1 flap endonuclease [Gemmatimonadota bacterium]MBT5141437.1 flap endonuclease [Gemmatimonadota bacterium]MBT5590670.1 flap endonuclease [Gemmatimonadota bacterium]